jgi:hypothetical protein
MITHDYWLCDTLNLFDCVTACTISRTIVIILIGQWFFKQSQSTIVKTSGILIISRTVSKSCDLVWLGYECSQ